MSSYLEELQAQAEYEAAQQAARDDVIEARRVAWEAQQAFEVEMARLAALAEG